MAESIRSFIAVNITATGSLRSLCERLQTMGRAVRAVDPDNLHVTMKFLGETDRDSIPRIAEILEETAAQQSAFELRLRGVGAFPHTGRPSIVWIGLENARPLVLMAETLELELEALGFEMEDRAFHPHLTVARIKAKPPSELSDLFQEHESTDFGTASVASIELIQSELTPNGPIYTVLHTGQLSADRSG